MPQKRSEKRATSQILDKFFEFHPFVLLHRRGVKIRVEHDDSEREHEDGLRVTQFRHDVSVALAVPLSENLHQPLDLLGLSRHPEVGLKFPESVVHLHSGQIYFVGEASVWMIKKQKFKQKSLDKKISNIFE